jgi:hypothetical protein
MGLRASERRELRQIEEWLRRELRQIEEWLRRHYPDLDALLTGQRSGRRLASRAWVVAGMLAGYLVPPALLVAGLVVHVHGMAVAGGLLCPLIPVMVWLTIRRRLSTISRRFSHRGLAMVVNHDAQPQRRSLAGTAFRRRAFASQRAGGNVVGRRSAGDRHSRAWRLQRAAARVGQSTVRPPRALPGDSGQVGAAAASAAAALISPQSRSWR